MTTQPSVPQPHPLKKVCPSCTFPKALNGQWLSNKKIIYFWLHLKTTNDLKVQMCVSTKSFFVCVTEANQFNSMLENFLLITCTAVDYLTMTKLTSSLFIELAPVQICSTFEAPNPPKGFH